MRGVVESIVCLTALVRTNIFEQDPYVDFAKKCRFLCLPIKRFEIADEENAIEYNKSVLNETPIPTRDDSQDRFGRSPGSCRGSRPE